MRISSSITLCLLIAAACSKSSSSTADTSSQAAASGAKPAATACDIATKEEMSTAVGSPVTETQSLSDNHCIFKTAQALAYADVEIDRENGAAAMQGISNGDSMIGASENTLAGIGDTAFYGPRDRLYFRKGNTFVAVEGGFDNDARERARKVAQLVAGKL